MLALSFTPFPTLTTQRLLLREMTLTDALALQHLRSKPDVMQYINRPLMHTVEEAEKMIGIITKAWRENEGITWCICLKDEPGELVGTIGFWRIDKENDRAEIGYMLEPHLHGKGVMFEALQKVLDYGFKEIKLHSVEAHLDPRNIASAKLLEKAGFVQEGYFRENYKLRDNFADTAVYSLLTSIPSLAVEEPKAESSMAS